MSAFDGACSIGGFEGERRGKEIRNILFGLPITASSCLFCSGNADTVAVMAKAAAMVFVKCIFTLCLVF